MTQYLIAFSYWLHTAATVVFIGHFVLLACIYIPALVQNGTALGMVSSHSRPWMYASLIVFIVTGIHLMLSDPEYQGLGNFRSFWAIAMLVKHILIIGMVAIGFWFNVILRVGPMLRSNRDPETAIARFRKYAAAMAVLGVFVLLLTALSQVQQ